MHSLQTTK